MEKALKSYSIESPTIVQLLMNDGTELRVAAADLPKYLNGADLDRVKSAFVTRSKYFKSLPKWTAVFGFTSVIAFMVISRSGMVAHQAPISHATRTTSVPMAATSIDVQQTGSITLVTSNPQSADGITATEATSLSKAATSKDIRSSVMSQVKAQPSNSPLNPQSIESIVEDGPAVNVTVPVDEQDLAPAKHIVPPGLLK